MATMKKILEVPKRPKTAYILFSTEKRTSLDRSMSMGEQSKVLGEMWKILSQGERSKYEEAYKKEKENYDCIIKELEMTEEGRILLEESKRRKKKVRREGGKVRRQKKVTSYNIFMKERAAQLKEEVGDEKLKFKDMVRKISQAWNDMTESEKGHYKLLADEKNLEEQENN